MPSGKNLGKQRLSMYLGAQIIDLPFYGLAKITLVFSASTQPVGLGITYDISEGTKPVEYTDIIPYTKDAVNYTKDIITAEEEVIKVTRSERGYPSCGGDGIGNIIVEFETPTPLLYFGVNLNPNSYSGAVTCAVYIDDEYSRTITFNVPRTQNGLVQNFAWYVYSANDIYNV